MTGLVWVRKSSVVGVAQLVERRIVIPVVVGSNPIVHPNFYSEVSNISFWPANFLAGKCSYQTASSIMQGLTKREWRNW